MSTASSPSLPARIGAATFGVLSSMWTAIALFTFLFIYSSIGSALPFVRQMRMFEMTEFQWFHWWPFDVSVILLGISITLATWKRVPLRWNKAGTWIAHSGILILLIGSWIYFGTKREGDTPVIRRQVVINIPGVEPTSLVALPGAATQVDSPDGPYQFQIADIRPDWPILSGDDAGKEAYSVSVQVTTPSDTFIRQLLDGYPQYTEDIIPGKGRAVRSTGKKLLDEELKLSLDLEPQPHFYLMETWALYVREKGTTQWFERPIEGLPRYNDYIATRGEVWQAEGEEPLPIDPIDIEVPADLKDDPFGDIDLRVTGYLRYAVQRRQWTPGGDDPNPFVEMRLSTNTGNSADYQLLAMSPQHSTAEEGQIVFEMVPEGTDLETVKQPSLPWLTFRINGVDEQFEFPITDMLSTNPALDPVELGDTGYSYRVRFVANDLVVKNGRSVSVAVIEIESPEKKWVRWVADAPGMTRDMPSDAMDGHDQLEMDTSIGVAYSKGEAPTWLTLYTQPGTRNLTLRQLKEDASVIWHDVKPGDATELEEGLTMEITRFMPNAQLEERPAVIPRHRRDRDLKELFSRAKVEVADGGVREQQWVGFQQHVFPGKEYEYLGRFIHQPKTFTLADGREMEVAFSRERQELPAPVGLDDFHLKTHIGGYTGETNSIRDWTSEIVFQQPDGSWSDTAPVSVNAPAEKKGLWFFQSSWDKPAPSSGSNGLNYTGLGVGNRNGVFIQLLGCIIAVLGMIFGFYIKPMLMPAAAKKAAVKSDDKSAEVSSEAAPAEGGMSPMKFAAGVVIIIAAFGSLIAYRMYDPTRANAPEPTEFERTIDLEPLDQVAVHASGRLRSFPSHAQTYVRYITGPRRVMGQSSAFTYLDMMFRPDSYLHVPTIYVKSKNVRRNIVQTVNEFEGMAELLPENFMKEGLLPPILLGAPPVEKLLERLGSDLIRTAKHVNAIETAKTVLDPTFLTQRLRLIPPPKNDLEQQWHHVQELLPEVHHSHGANAESVNTGFAQQDLGIADIPDDVEEELAHLWSDLRTAWVEQDAEAANVALAAFAKVLPEISPEAYPSQQRLKLESWYFGQRNMTWVWLVYMLSTVFLLMSIVYGWNWARHTGMGIFALAFLLHTISLGLRWYVSGRWPNSNMFEAVTTAAWFGGCVAILLEWICRNNPMRNLFALGSAGASMTALMAAHFLPVQLNPTIGNMMPVLYDLWLYIHTNVIILSYCLIAMAAITGALYLAWRAAGGSADYARVGGAGSLMSGRLSGKNASLGAVFDGATMILMEISFVLLWAGIVMGAIWADHSWGRPWGWDPKEVFALNTFLVFLVLIHIRFIVKDKGLWTAWLALIGCFVMLFNWIVINFVISGLHSYA